MTQNNKEEPYEDSRFAHASGAKIHEPMGAATTIIRFLCGKQVSNFRQLMRNKVGLHRKSLRVTGS